MLTIKAEIKKSEQRSDKTYNVKLRFTLNRKVKRISTSLFVTPNDLTKSLKIKPSSPVKKEIDELVRLFVAEGGVNTCPHGRPIIVKITKYELEKMFKRIQ